jgi:hypothetical protein
LVLAAGIEQWRQEYAANIQPIPQLVPARKPGPDGPLRQDGDWWDLEPWNEAFDGVFYEPMTEGNFHEARF